MNLSTEEEDVVSVLEALHAVSELMTGLAISANEVADLKMFLIPMVTMEATCMLR